MKRLNIFYFMPGDDVLDDDAIVQCTQEVCFQLFGFVQDNGRKGSVLHVIIKRCFIVRSALTRKFKILNKREWKHLDLHITASQKCCQFRA